MNRKEDNKTARSRLYTSVLLVLMAFVAVTAATVAWFSIADRAKVKTMSLDIIADADLRQHGYCRYYMTAPDLSPVSVRL